MPGQLQQCVMLIGVKKHRQHCAAADLLRWQACDCLEQLILLQASGSHKSCDGLPAEGTVTCCLGDF